ncbi:hypothetical protein [Oceanicoccus sagamiensis]|uniref:ABM domain-containing protein n=1 Tax=Oceanicoccus sagamiensis TaxID=716816 RepID=A0A1X9NBT7_9GAMM|nr:hypothetical protein [Oceanicoccus sagamiensis]ARN73365.1 hypothetical protein BST96_04120 [Oceanicoccus sagamiensis]
MNVVTEYKIKADQVGAQKAALIEFAAQLKQLNNPDIKFTAYHLHDGVSFKHVTYLKDDATAGLLMSQEFYKTLGEGTSERCEAEPNFSPMDMVATFKV